MVRRKKSTAWQRFNRADEKLTTAFLPYAMTLICIFMVGQSVYEWFVSPWYPEGFFPTQTIEGRIESVGVTSTKRGSKRFKIAGEDREFVLPRGLPKSANYQPMLGDDIAIQTASAAKQGNWLNSDRYWQVMAIKVGDREIYSVSDYEAYKIPAEWESSILVTLATVLLVGMTYFLYWRRPKAKRKR